MSSELISLITSIVAAFIAGVSQIMLFKFRNNAEKELEKLRIKYKHLEKVEELKSRYSMPLLKSAEGLYNKINDVVKNRERVSKYFEHLENSISKIRTLEDILSKPTNIYLLSIIYLFANYFANIEAIKKDVGLLQLATDEETRILQSKIRQTTAVFFSGRLHRNFKIRKDDILRYQGTILEGAQILIGEAMLKDKNGTREAISFYEFCQRFALNEEFKQTLRPLIYFLSDLKEEYEINSQTPEVDFRWAKLILFASFLRKLIKQIDTAKVVKLLPELEIYELDYLARNNEIRENIDHFTDAYPSA